MNVQQNKTTISRTLIKTILVNVINVFVLVGIFLLLTQLPKRAQEVKKVTAQIQAGQQMVDTAVLQADIEKNNEKVSALNKVLAGDDTVIAFVSQLDQLKAAGTVTEYEFPITAEISDKTGLKGLPVAIVITGSQETVSKGIQSITSLPLLLRPITLSVTVAETGEYTAKFGGFLYIKQ